MSHSGAIWLSDYKGKTVEFYCIKCEKAGAASGSDLLEEFGDQDMPMFRYTLARRFDCARGPDAAFNDKCQISYIHRSAITPNPKPDAARTIGELEEYNTLFAQCLACKRRKPLSRWDIQRKYGKDLTMGALAKAMRCKCGNKGASLYVGNMSR